MMALLLALLVPALLTGADVLVLYSRTQHGFFTLREVRRCMLRGIYICRRWWAGSARRGTGSLP
jgi:hypothetical protein